MVVVGAGAGGVAAEEDGSAVELEGVVEGVEHLRRDETAREEHVRAGERHSLPYRRHLRRLLSLPLLPIN